MGANLRNAPDSADSGPCHAALDVGSHTIRVLVAKVPEPGVLVPILQERHIARLAKDYAEPSGLSREAMARALSILQGVAERVEAFRPRTIRAGATGVVRKAVNGRDFLRRAAEVTGLQVPVLTEDEEALLSLRGMLGVLKRPEGPLLAFDLGGSSTEFSLTLPGDQVPCWTTSLFVGAAVLTQQFLERAPAPPEALRKARRHVRDLLGPVCRAVKSAMGDRPARWPVPVGTAGTVTTLAAMHLGMRDYVPYRINNQRLSASWVCRTVERLSAMSLEQRRRIPGLEAGREDIILGGALIVEEILAAFEAEQLIVTDAGLLEGLLLDGITRQVPRPGTGGVPLTWEIKWD